MVDLVRKKKILEELVKARHAVKQKYNLIRSQKDDTDRILNETFKPITEPLHKLVEKKQNNRKKFNASIKEDNESLKEDNESFIDSRNQSFVTTKDIMHNDDDEFNESLDSNNNEDLEKTVVEDEDLGIEIPKKFLDGVYGVFRTENGLKFGSVPIRFKKDSIIVNDKTFPRTPGLYELILHKRPANYEISDLTVYKRVLEESNAHRKGNQPNAAIKKHISRKYNDVIAPIFNLSPLKEKTSSKSAVKKAGLSTKLTPNKPTPLKGGTGLLPRFKIARRNTRMDYIYWDDPNELVDRLRLLIDEREAGNLSHTNEIHSIIEELREGGYIY